MSDAIVDLANFETVLSEMLKEYGDKVFKASDECLDAAAKVMKDALVEATPRRRPQMYRKWKIKKYKGERYIGNDEVAPSRKSGDIPLTNVLEYSTKHGHPFIATTYEQNINAAVDAAINQLKKEI